jgi:hypothetical protein
VLVVAAATSWIYARDLVGADAHVVGRVVFLIDQLVRGGPEDVAEHAILAQRHRVLAGVEERLVVVGPRQRSGDVGRGVGVDLAGLQVLHVEHVLIAPDGVVDPRQGLAVAGHVVRADPVVGVTRGERVAVEEDLLGGGYRAPAPAEDRLLFPALEPRVVPVAAVEGRDAGVVLLDPAAQLGEQRGLEGGVRGQHLGRVRVLRRQVRQHLGVGAGVVAEPVVGVVAAAVGRRHGVIAPRGDRRHGLAGCRGRTRLLGGCADLGRRAGDDRRAGGAAGASPAGGDDEEQHERARPMAVHHLSRTTARRASRST